MLMNKPGALSHGITMSVLSKDGTDAKNLELDHSWLGQHQSRRGGRTLTWHETGDSAVGQKGVFCTGAKSNSQKPWCPIVRGGGLDKQEREKAPAGDGKVREQGLRQESRQWFGEGLGRAFSV